MFEDNMVVHVSTVQNDSHMLVEGCPHCRGTHKYINVFFPEGTQFMLRCPEDDQWFSITYVPDTIHRHHQRSQPSTRRHYKKWEK